MDTFEEWARKDLISKGVDPAKAAEVVATTYGPPDAGRPNRPTEDLDRNPCRVCGRDTLDHPSYPAGDRCQVCGSGRKP